jgi:hypothetical protein
MYNLFTTPQRNTNVVESVDSIFNEGNYEIEELLESWYSVREAAFRATHDSIINDDSALNEAAMSDYIARVKKWFITMYENVKAFFNALTAWITSWFKKATAWISANKKRIEAGAAILEEKKVKLNLINRYVSKLANDGSKVLNDVGVELNVLSSDRISDGNNIYAKPSEYRKTLRSNYTFLYAEFKDSFETMEPTKSNIDVHISVMFEQENLFKNANKALNSFIINTKKLISGLDRISEKTDADSELLSKAKDGVVNARFTISIFTSWSKKIMNAGMPPLRRCVGATMGAKASTMKEDATDSILSRYMA